jgi:hypothetical protein
MELDLHVISVQSLTIYSKMAVYFSLLKVETIINTRANTECELWLGL